jgi:predicted ATPase/DNA-binding CsgD family transcriptional regulator
MAWDPGGGGLPVPAGPIIGRGSLVGDVIDVIGAERLVTLTGVGGVGKTALALEVGARAAGGFAHGVRLVELAPVGDPASVPAAIASALGVTPQGDADPIDTVAEALAGRSVLLVIDNCEHVARAAAIAVETMLARSDNLRVLTTSREPLWLAGEQRLAVVPLGLEGGVEADAVELFVERARTVRPGFVLDDDETADAVVEICATLDGLPLAIELAAARMASMTAIELRDRLDHRFRLLTGAGHRPERQQTLAATVGWSYDLLDEDDREALCVASVFSGGFGLGDIVAVADTVDEIDILAHLDSLIGKSLVVAQHDRAHTRYRLLETIRQFAEDELPADRVERLRALHATHYARQAAARWERWNGPGWRDASDWMETELANLRAALGWSSEGGEVEVATDIAAHAALMGVPVQLFETVQWAEALLEAAETADVARLPRLYTGAGYACFAGRPVPAAENAHRATELETEPRYDPCEPGLATFVESLARVYSGDLDRYVELSAAVAALPGSARAYGLPAYVDGLQASGRVDEALALTEESVAAARELGNPFWIAYALWTAGLAHANTDPRRALAAWDEGVDVVRTHRVHFFEGFLARDAARLHAEDGDPATALQLFATAIETFQRAGNVAQLIITLASVPALLDRLGRCEGAASLHAGITQEPASLHHVPELADLGDSLAGKLDEETLAARTTIGTALDLNEVAAHAREEIQLAREDLAASGQPEERPGGLTRREVEVLRLVADGLTTREISGQLFISAKTADHHIQHIYTKIGVSTRGAATRWAFEHEVVGTTETL